MTIDAGLARLEMGGTWVAVEGMVNLEDLCQVAERRGHAIVRVRNSVDNVQFIPASDTQMLGCVAGWISEGE